MSITHKQDVTSTNKKNSVQMQNAMQMANQSHNIPLQSQYIADEKPTNQQPVNIKSITKQSNANISKNY